MQAGQAANDFPIIKTIVHKQLVEFLELPNIAKLSMVSKSWGQYWNNPFVLQRYYQGKMDPPPTLTRLGERFCKERELGRKIATTLHAHFTCSNFICSNGTHNYGYEVSSVTFSSQLNEQGFRDISLIYSVHRPPKGSKFSTDKLIFECKDTVSETRLDKPKSNLRKEQQQIRQLVFHQFDAFLTPLQHHWQDFKWEDHQSKFKDRVPNPSLNNLSELQNLSKECLRNVVLSETGSRFILFPRPVHPLTSLTPKELGSKLRNFCEEKDLNSGKSCTGEVRQFLEIVQLAKEKNQINAQEEKTGKTALHIALQKQHFNMAYTLLTQGAADLNLPNKEGVTSRDLINQNRDKILPQTPLFNFIKGREAPKSKKSVQNLSNDNDFDDEDFGFQRMGLG